VNAPGIYTVKTASNLDMTSTNESQLCPCSIIRDRK